jgi:3',5'-cyclic AMP phosphodiesterase CpdA
MIHDDVDHTPRVLARIPAIRTTEPTRLGILADPHLATRASGTWKCYHRTETFLRRAVAGVQSIDPDRTLVVGDLTKDGEASNFDRYDELVAPLPEPLTIPGNHDVPKEYVDHDVMAVSEFADRYTEVGYPFRQQVGGVDVFCLNSAAMPDDSLRDTWGGRVSRSQLDWLASELGDATLPVVAVHHNVFAQPEHDGGFWTNFPLENSEELADVLAAHSPVLVVSGHHHIPSYGRERGVHELIAPALCSYPPSYLVVDIGPDGTLVRRIPVTTPTERTESYTLGATGKELGRAVVELAADRADAKSP